MTDTDCFRGVNLMGSWQHWPESQQGFLSENSGCIFYVPKDQTHNSMSSLSICPAPQIGVVVAWVYFASSAQPGSRPGREDSNTHMIPNPGLMHHLPSHFQRCPLAHRPQILTLCTAANCFPFQPHQPEWFKASWNPFPPTLPGPCPIPTLTLPHHHHHQQKELWKWAGVLEDEGTICSPPLSETPVRAGISRYYAWSP